MGRQRGFVASLNADGTANRDADAVTVLSLNNAVFDIANGYLDVVKLKGYSATDSFMHIDVDTDNMESRRTACFPVTLKVSQK